MGFSTILKRLRKSRGVTQTELAKIFNVSKSAISMYELGEREPSFEILEKISNYFNVSVDYLLGNSDKEKEKTPSNDEDVKVALFGGDLEVTDEMWNEVKQYAEFIKSKYNKS